MKAKFKIMQLAAKPVDFELIHPVHGATGIIVKLAGPHSKEFRATVERLQQADQTNVDLIARGVEILSACIVGWDEEAFEMPWSPEAAKAFITLPENQWAAEQLGAKINDQALFFPAIG